MYIYVELVVHPVLHVVYYKLFVNRFIAATVRSLYIARVIYTFIRHKSRQEQQKR